MVIAMLGWLVVRPDSTVLEPGILAAGKPPAPHQPSSVPGRSTSTYSSLVEIDSTPHRSAGVPAANHHGGLGDRSPAATIRPGTVQLRVLDKVAGVDLHDIEIRCTTEDRFLTRTIDSPVELRLSPGVWSLSLRRFPYEACAPVEFRVLAGAEVVLDDMALVRPSGTIAGCVDVPDRIAAHGAFTIELYGEGRGPCDLDCTDAGEGEACAKCGYRPEASNLVVQPGETFAFGRLQSGSYRAVVYDGGKRVLFNEHIDLPRGGHQQLDLRLEFVDVEFDITDAAGHPFNGVWVEEDKTFEGPIEFHFHREGLVAVRAQTSASSSLQFRRNANGTTEFVHRTDRTYLRDPLVIQREARHRGSIAKQVQAQLQLPQFDLTLQPELLAEIRRSMESSTPKLGTDKAAAPPMPRPMDVPREPAQEPGFASPTPSPAIQSAALSAKKLGPGRYLVMDVPVRVNGVFITCGPHQSAASFDLWQAGGQPVRVRLGERCPKPSTTFVGARSCFQCHESKELARMR